MARERSPKLPADPEHASNHQTKADSATTDKHPPVTTQSPPANAVAGTVDPPTAQPSRGESGRPLIAPANQEEDEDWFADIAQLFIQVQALENEFRRETSIARKGKRFAPSRATPRVEAPSAREQSALAAAEDHPPEILEARAEQGQNATLLVREFVSPAGSVFHAREEDWIEATTRGLRDVVLCDPQGRYIEPNMEGKRVKTTLRVSIASTYEQTLVHAQEDEPVPVQEEEPLPTQVVEPPGPKPKRFKR